jgi:1-acyl-sn-glycerol-3-phosphate acyltransferase
MAGGAPHSTVNGNGTVNGRDRRIYGAPPQGRQDPRADGDVRAPGVAPEGNLLGRAAKRLAAQVQQRVPRADLDERDPDYIRETLPRLWLLCSLYFRGEVRGLGNIPDAGPVLLVGNHSGGTVTPDTTVFSLAFHTYFGVERRFHQLAHHLVLSAPGLGFLRRYGTVAASTENARAALRSGAAVLVYPGGDREVHRPSWQSGRVDFGDHKDYIRLALEEDVPIVPVVAIGGQETALFLSQGEWLSKFLMLDKLLALKVLPISLAAPWGLNVGDFLGHLPLPSKIVVEVLPPIRPREEHDGDVNEIHAHVTRLMQDTLDALSSERRFPVIG